MPSFTLYQKYTREKVHHTFCPSEKFTPQSGTWGLHGIVHIKGTDDFVFFVTLGSKQAGHQFIETITPDGILSWQSQPHQSLSSSVIRTLIQHDAARNHIYLFFRQNTRQNSYLYLGQLAYVNHDPEKECPVNFQWQILHWDPPEKVRRLCMLPSAVSEQTQRQGNYYSWEIPNDRVAIKLTDLSVFRYRGSGIPKKARWFWGVDHWEGKEEKELLFLWEDASYKATVRLQNGRTRLFWHGDLAQKLQAYCPEGDSFTPAQFPFLRFSKCGQDAYELTLLGFEHLETDIALEGETFSDATSAPSLEGAGKKSYATRYERDPKNRKACIKIHGTKCAVCGFDFEKTYGPWGRDYIEVHHLIPLSQMQGESLVNPATEMKPLCSNCHRMVHRKKDQILSIEELQAMLRKNREPF
ncbi:DUF3427 domain-containing protein [Zongyangia hominis]|uniref:DUF3427 domain-containing protein n=1 Tax=Zongyangia hominis TaxID=2763677 RepID=A0A926IB90_9FIRM|nr:DUF3427 domain-containing protein [Zongyangia hominis]MBC8569927.1 DUF3427 domain-containing protein [Zongyangia hominis]